ncbi:MAG: hypothetical protein AAFV07_18915, partial [Bacteroidota bacterium]
MTLRIFALIPLLLCLACKPSSVSPETCTTNPDLQEKVNRPFRMGFSTWSYGATNADKTDTYQFILQHGDIYSEQVDDRIPWQAWMDGNPLPTDFEADIQDRVARKPA